MRLALPRTFSRRLTSAIAAVMASVTLAAPMTAQTPQASISGRVTDAANNPLADTRVFLVGSALVTTTNPDGKYTLRGVPVGTQTVRVLRVGYQEAKKTVTVADGQAVTLDFAMAQAVVQLQEIVTTATGEQRRVEIGNAVTTLNNIGQKVQETPITNLQDLLAGKAAGVSVVAGAIQGSAPLVRIRGANSLSLRNDPIYVIDGIRLNSGTLASGAGQTNLTYLGNINPEEIEDIEIVKGPSAATLYGTDAANGVIVITTKKGKAGATRWTWSAEQGMVQDKNSYLTGWALWGHKPGAAAGSTPIRCFNSTVAAGTCAVDSTTSLNVFETPGITPIANGSRALYGMQVNGGSESVRYFVSGDLENEIGPVKMPEFSQKWFDSLHVPMRDEWIRPQAFQREGFRANLSATVSPKLDIQVNTGFAKSDQRVPQVDNNLIGYQGAAEFNAGFQQCGLEYNCIGKKKENLMGYDTYEPGQIFQRLSQTGIQRTIVSATASWRPLSWLANDATAGVDLAERNLFRLCRFGECAAQGTDTLGFVGDLTGTDRTFSAKVASNATWQYRPWMNLKTTVGADYNNVMTQNTQATGNQLPPGGQTIGAAAVQAAANTLPTATKTLGVYVQEQASINDRLFITGALRSDQNSAFGTNFQRVVYPKASVSWIVSDEGFFPKLEWLNQLRLRSAYGASGVQPGATSSLVTYAATVVNINRVETPGVRASALGNPDLKPETSAEFENGFEARMLDSRVNFDFTFYSKKTKDALISLPIAPSAASSATSVLKNLGSVKNAGIEANINATLIDRHNFGWDITVGGSHNSNKIVTLGVDANGQPNKTIGTGAVRDSVGFPVNAWFYRPYTFKDANGDGLLQVSEVTVDSIVQYRGYSSPRDMITVQSGFELFARKLRVNVSLDRKSGYSLSNGTFSFQCQSQHQNCYDSSNQNATLEQQARVIALVNKNPNTSGGFLENGSFWRLREISGTLNLPATVAQRIRARDASLTFGARNLKLWTNYGGIDPEANYNSGQSGTADTQNEFSTTAPPRYFTVRLNLHY